MEQIQIPKYDNRKVDKKIGELEASIKHLDGKIDNIDLKIDDFFKKVFIGNGKPAMVEEITIIKEYVKNHQIEHTKLNDIKKNSSDMFFKIGTLLFAFINIFLIIIKI